MAQILAKDEMLFDTYVYITLNSFCRSKLCTWLYTISYCEYKDITNLLKTHTHVLKDLLGKYNL